MKGKTNAGGSGKYWGSHAWKKYYHDERMIETPLEEKSFNGLTYGGVIRYSDSYNYDKETNMFSLGDIIGEIKLATAVTAGTLDGMYLTEGSENTVIYKGTATSTKRQTGNKITDLIQCEYSITHYFVDFVVSDNAEEYPNGGIHTDGYWYDAIG